LLAWEDDIYFAASIGDSSNLKLAFKMSDLVETMTMPVANGHAGDDEDAEMNFATKDGALRFSSGLILPPPEIKCELSPTSLICTWLIRRNLS
jgi:hypothetical protein